MIGTGAGCRTCRTLRVFLGLSLLLIVLIGLRPTGVVLLASYFPDAMMIGLGIILGGALAFALRYVAWRSVRRRARPTPAEV